MNAEQNENSLLSKTTEESDDLFLDEIDVGGNDCDVSEKFTIDKREILVKNHYIEILKD